MLTTSPANRDIHQLRIEALDWQRGILAVSIMVYHLLFWHAQAANASSVIGRLGIYGVSMFFVLSGLSMAIAYERYEIGVRSSLKFYLRRLFRIWPLLWVAVIVVSVSNVLIKHESVSAYKIAINLTTVFGFIEPMAYINTGAWSIGNEIVYYFLTPAILFAYRKRIAFGNLMLAASLAIGLYFSENMLSSDAPLDTQWSLYVNPFNNLFFYIAGIAIFYNTSRARHTSAQTVAFLAISTSVFLFYPTGENQADIVTDLNRIVFSSASILMVYVFYKWRATSHVAVTYPLEKLGIITYGVYLLHPIVNSALVFAVPKMGMDLGATAKILLVSAATIVAALVAYETIEKPMIKFGKWITTRHSNRALPDSLSGKI